MWLKNMFISVAPGHQFTLIKETKPNLSCRHSQVQKWIVEIILSPKSGKLTGEVAPVPTVQNWTKYVCSQTPYTSQVPSMCRATIAPTQARGPFPSSAWELFGNSCLSSKKRRPRIQSIILVSGRRIVKFDYTVSRTPLLVVVVSLVPYGIYA